MMSALDRRPGGDGNVARGGFEGYSSAGNPNERAEDTMRASALVLSAALALPGGVSFAQDWLNVKSWSGTVTIEATTTKAPQDWYSSKTTYKASGNFTISDDMLPAGSHVRWPFPGQDKLSDPKMLQAAYEPWQARVVASYEAKGVDEAGRPFAVTCAADNRQAAKVGLTASPRSPTFVVSVSAPEAVFKCAGAGPNPNSRLPQETFDLTGPRGEPGPVTATKTFTVGTTTIKVSYNMAPSQ